MDEYSMEFVAEGLAKENFELLYQFYQSRDLCDVEIKVGNKIFHCHRLVLACVSQYFKAMFKSQMAESKEKSISIKDIDEEAMDKLIQYAYTARIKLSTDNVQSVLYAASILQIETVANACSNFMQSHLHPSNCIEVRSFAELHNRVELIKTTDNYIRDNFIAVSQNEEFLSMPIEILTSLVSSPDLNVDSEEQVYSAIMVWIKHDNEKRKPHLPELLSKVKLPLLDPVFLMTKVGPDEMINNSFECRDLVNEAMSYRMSIANIVPEVKITERSRPRKSYAGVLFCVGGRGASGDPFKSIECYDPRQDKWFPVADMTTRRRHVGVCSYNGLLYAVGGHDGSDHLRSGEMFDPKTNTWKPIAQMETLRRGIALACLGDVIYAVGGLDDATCFNTVERYDPVRDSWSFIAPMDTPRGGVGVTTLKGQLYALGGNDGTCSLDNCEKYDPYLNRWSPIAPMHKRRAGAGVAVLDNYIYVVGGFDDNSPLDCVEKYDPKLNKWSFVGSMSCCRGGVGVSALGGRLYAVGGHDGSNYLNSVEAYDPLTNKWEPAQGIQQYRAGAGVTYCDCSPKLLRQVTSANSTGHL
ncbi:kelch-like protein 8 isoform X2 [Physella acuta]|uniref:kelch-like protein 8 isoform X2 n=1 Tax=Physella acuta TaxID=109671 RepID=UPI0027DB5E1C|nr:kelch-like protein 8 isoform X2 [Physella acuta]